jgi:putative phage-type endonuclease
MTTTTADSDWHAWRAQGIGASEVPALLGLSNYDSPWSLWARKVGLLVPAKTEETERQRLGHDLEPVIAGRFRRATGLEVAGEQAWCQHKDHPWARATVDAFVVEPPAEPSIDAAIGVAEWKSDGGLGTWRREGIPARIQAQVQAQMWVTGLDHAWLGVFHSGFRFEVYELERDERDITLIAERAEAFWVGNVLAGVPPQPDASDATARAIGQVYGQEEPGKRVELPEHLAGVGMARARLKQEAKELEDRLKKIDNELRAAMGDAEVATVDGVPVFSLRAQERRDIDRDALRRDHPDIAAAYETTKSFRVLRPATKKDKAVAA